mgnify:CR=1 FL=1
MSGKKGLVWFVSFALMAALLSIGFGGAVAAEGPDWSAAADGVLGQYIAAASVPAGSLIAGKTPTVGTTDTAWEVKSGSAAADKLTDGQFCTGAADRVLYELWKHDYNSGSWAAFTFTLDAATAIDRFLIGSETGSAQYLTDVRVYVSDTLETLYEDSSKVAEAAGVTLGNYFIRGDVKTGRYVGFAFKNPGGYWSAPWYGEIRFGELAVYGVGEPDWTYATEVTKGQCVPADGRLQPDSRIAGLLPTQGLTGEEWPTYNGPLTYVTDGALVQADNANRAQLNLNPTVPAGQWAQLTFDMGYAARLTHFLVGSEYGSGQYLTDVRIYVSGSLSELYSETSLVTEASGVTLGNYYLKGETTVGRYVGFAFKNPGGFWSAPWYGLLRIGELAAYGEPAVLTSGGAQLRDPAAADGYALRFGFDVAGTGIVYASADPAQEHNYARDLSAAYITVNGEVCKLLNMGAVVANTADFGEELTKEDVNGRRIKDVVAENLYTVEEKTVRFTAVIVKIPAGKEAVTLYAVPYVEYESAAGTGILYGETISRSVSELLNAVE